ncbi:MAG: hypothetical protein H6631_16040 [Anaerolineaceae bacterium]|nr:hypothetical protein [Anaerolineaceae bacterium]MCB9102079.1 hypothetical protein [Anaerolineales bacterium]
MIKVTFQEKTPAAFHFKSTARSHGWVMLRPFNWNEDAGQLSRLQQLHSGQVVRLGMIERAGAVQIEVEAAQPLTPAEETEIKQAVRRMLRLDEDLSEFHAFYTELDGWQLRLEPGGGRLLRCATLFEDIVYTLCTTNINWSGTIRMVDRLVTALGRPLPGDSDSLAFPSPADIAATTPEFLKLETGLGYRSPYVWELAVAVAEERLDLADFEDPDKSTKEVLAELNHLKGVGPYAAATILMILGRYEHLAIDSEMRSFVSKKYFGGERVTPGQIQTIYAPWGRWQYLAYWFDMPPE